MTRQNITNILDRRVKLQKPVETRDSHNERHTSWVTVIEGLPAGKPEDAKGGSEKEEDNSVNSSLSVEWQVRYFGPDAPKATWQLTDQHGQIYDIQSVSEIGRRVGWVLQTKMIQ